LDNNLEQRENFKAAFDHFDYKKIAQYSDDKILDLLQDAGIIRNKLKVYSAVTNAQATKSRRIWSFRNTFEITPIVTTSQET
jgi:3-methyladenine DNA glycosylase Tag